MVDASADVSAALLAEKWADPKAVPSVLMSAV
jgi:hypothetical protein